MASALSIYRSNLPVRAKSTLLEWYDGVKASGGLARRARSMPAAVGQVVRSSAEAGAIGSALGFAAARLQDGLDQAGGKAPIDGLVGVAGALGTLALAGTESAFKGTFDTANKLGFGLWAFRKTEAFVAAKSGTGGTVIARKVAAIAAHGDDPAGSNAAPGMAHVGADPLMAWANKKFTR